MNFLPKEKGKLLKQCFILSSIIGFVLPISSCQKSRPEYHYNYEVIEADKNVFNATINSTVANDVYGRSFGESDVATSDKKVGMFYFIWHGEHVNNGIFDVTKLNSNPETKDILWAQDPSDKTISPLYEFHYFSEPLYGYYCSDDPWVLAKHVELLTMSGIDYISLDLTNISIYEKNTRAVLEALLKFQNLGWKVPLVTSYIIGTNNSLPNAQRVLDFYNLFIDNERYSSLWLRDDASNKPILSIDRDTYLKDMDPIVVSNVKFRNTIWPFDKSQTAYDDSSWLDWCYPQRVYENSDGNYMSVSVAQHVAGSFGVSVEPDIKGDPNVRTAYAKKYNQYDTGAATNYDSNRGRGWDYNQNRNIKENAFKGTNLETQWDNAINSEKPIDEVFVCGWNEWVAYKLPFAEIHGGSAGLDEIYGKYYDKVTFCDQCDEEFSRDLEMTKDGYGDNFYLQNMRRTREFKGFKEQKFAGKYASENLTNNNWQNARTYLDFTEEVFDRDFDRADHQEKYVNTTAKNDIKSVKMSHDGNNLYIQIENNNRIVIDHDKTNNFNVLLSLNEGNNWNGYNYILNKNDLTKGNGKTNLEAFTGNEFDSELVTECDYYMDDKTISIAIPLEKLGLTSKDKFTVDFKVADGVTNPEDIMDYYVNGDSAPIGRLNYRYNSEHF